jgi:hypothetical protein
MFYCPQCGFLCETTKDIKLAIGKKEEEPKEVIKEIPKEVQKGGQKQSADEASGDETSDDEFFEADRVEEKKEKAIYDDDSDSEPEVESDSSSDEEVETEIKRKKVMLKGDYSKIIEKALNDVVDDNIIIADYNDRDLTHHVDFKKLSSKNKSKVLGAIQHMIPSDSKKWRQRNATEIGLVYWRCINCRQHEVMKAGTLLYSQYLGKHAKRLNVDKIREMARDPTIPLTRNYVCHNKACESRTDPAKGEMAIVRPEVDSLKIVNVCLTCNEIWN